MTDRLTRRDLAGRDLDAVRALLRQLGYDVDAGELKRRFTAVSDAPGQFLRVAEDDGKIIGLIHAFVRPALEKPLEAIVQALVVDDTVRGKGVGRLLMEDAEEWASRRGLTSAAVATQTTREDAKAFYGRLGYVRAATSDLLRKPLNRR